MENAAKAIIMAGGVLIAVALLSLFSYLVTQLGGSTSSMYKELDSSKVAEFNQQFLNFENRGMTLIGYKTKSGKIIQTQIPDSEPFFNPLTAQDVATIINLARNNNKSQQMPTVITVNIEGTDWGDVDNSNHEAQKWLEQNQSSNDEYNCNNVHVNPDTLLVDQITIEKHHTTPP